MVATFQGISDVWKRQVKNWRIIVIRASINRFFNQLTLQYQNIFLLKLGANAIQIGEVNSTAHVMSTLVSAPIGWLQDRYSMKKIFSMGLALLAIVPLIYALANDWIWGIPAIILSAFAMREGACGAICDTTLRTEDRATGRSICESIGNAPSILAPLLAAIILSFFGGITVEGIRSLFWIQFVARLSLFVYVVKRMTKIVRPPQKQLNFLEGYNEVFKRGITVKRFILFLSLGAFINMMVTPFKYPFATEIKNADEVIIGVMSAIAILVGVSFGAWVGKLADRMGRKKMYYIIAPIYIVSYLGFVLAPIPEFLIISEAMFGFSTIVRMIIEPSIRAELVPLDCIGRWRGLLMMFSGLISIPAPIIGGLIWEGIGPEFIFLLAIVLEIARIGVLSTIPETLNLNILKRN
jgi:MFS family permease